MKVTTEACLFGAWVDPIDAMAILDIGAGTGLLSLMLAQRSSAMITAIEMDQNAAEQCEENFRASNWVERLNIVNKRIQDFKPEPFSKFDLVISNPPFYQDHPKPSSSIRQAAHHNDHLTTEQMLISIDRLLSENGTFYVMHPEYMANDFMQKAAGYKLFPFTELRVFNRPGSRIFRIYRGYTRRKSPINVNDMYIRHKEKIEYTKSFQRLLDPFYL